MTPETEAPLDPDGDILLALTFKGLLSADLPPHQTRRILNAIELHCRRNGYNAIVFDEDWNGRFVAAFEAEL